MAERTQRDIALKARQIGFTTEEVIRDVWFFLTKPGANVAVFVQVDPDRQSLKKVCAQISLIFDALKTEGVHLDFGSETTTEWTLPSRNASLRVVEAAGTEEAAKKQGRGATYQRVHITELAFYAFATDFLNGILETVAAPEYGTEIVIESTPNGVGGAGAAYYRLFMNAARAGYRAHFYPWFEQQEYRTALAEGETVTPETDREHHLVRRFNISQEQLKWYRAKVAEKGQDLVDQEYPSDPQTCFLSSGRRYFDKARTTELLLGASDPIHSEEVGREGSQGVLRIWKDPTPGEQYLVAIDPSEGVGGDPGVAGVFSRRTGEHVATLSGQFSTWEIARLCRGPDKLDKDMKPEKDYGPPGLAAVYNNALVAVERNNHGHAVLQAFERAFTQTRVYEARDGKPGWLNSPTSRSSALQALHEAHRTKAWSTPDAESLQEIRDFVVTEKGKAQAESGSHDDHVLMHAIALDVLTHVRWKPPSGDRKPPPPDGSRWGDQRGF
jgi:hypothetical protein